MPSYYENLGYEVAKIVFHPDYYKGEWNIFCNNRVRRCRNHATACAWAKFLERNLPGARISVGKVLE